MYGAILASKTYLLLDETYQVSVVLEGKVKVGDPTSVTENENISFLLESMLLNFFFFVVTETRERES
jgi:hypothetical protein